MATTTLGTFLLIPFSTEKAFSYVCLSATPVTEGE